MRRILLVSLLAVGLISACGGDTNNNNKNKNQDVGTDVQADAGMNDSGNADSGMADTGMNDTGMADTGMNDTGMNDTGTADTGTTDTGGNGNTVAESEPNNTGDNATAFTVGDTISGGISQGSGDTSDTDYFKVDLTGGTILQLDINDLGSGFTTSDGNQAEVFVFDDAQTYGWELNPNNGMTRQLFVPTTGTYYVVVDDARAFAQNPTDNGGPDSTYEIATKSVTPTPTDTTVPVDESGALTDGKVDVYKVTASADEVLLAETFAMRDPVASDLDSLMFVWSVDDSKTVGSNDDISYPDNTDSRLAFSATNGNSYWVVEDSYVNTAGDASYNLSVTKTDDSIDLPTSIADGGSQTGEISDRGSDSFDTDYFSVELQPGDVMRLEATADSDLQPHIAVIYKSQSFGNITIAEGWPVNGKAAVEFAEPTGQNATAETYLVTIDDARNVPADANATPANVGGSSYGYTLTANTTTWTPTSETLPLTTGDSIPDVGNYVWYSFSADADTVVGLRATTTAADFEPIVAELTDSGIASPSAQLVYVPSAQTDYTAGVRDKYFRGGAGYDFTPSFVSVSYGSATFNDVTESSSAHDTQSNAQDITSNLPAAVTGTLDGTNKTDTKPDVYKVTLSAGDQVGAFTAAGADTNTDDADTVLTVMNSSGDVVFTNDDYPGQSSAYFSAAAFAAAAAGDYFIKVEPYCSASDCSGNGDYTLKVVKQ